MFTVTRRDEITTLLLERARADARITGAAFTGSAAAGTADRWSDIDLFLGLAEGADVTATAAEWTAFARRHLGAAHHFELRSGPVVHRAILLDDLLEIDLGFAPAGHFRPLGDGPFRPVLGDPDSRLPAPADPGGLAGHGWHHVLHAASALDRGHCWRAVYWIGALRDRVLDLACLRHGLPAEHAKGADRLPPQVTDPLRATLVAEAAPAAAHRALRAATAVHLAELAHHDAALAATLSGPLTARVESAAGA